MNDFTNFTGERKATCRTLATVNLDRTYRRALFLPGKHLLCVRNALESGIIDKTTDVILAEYDPRLRGSVRRQAERLGIRYRLVTDNVTQIDMRCVKEPAGLVDYAFLDFCGTCNPQTARWLLETSRRWLSPTARVAFTFCGKARNNLDWFKAIIAAHGSRMPDGLHHNLTASANNWCSLIDYATERAVPVTAFLKAQFMVIAESLPFEYTLRESLLYRDTATPMVFFHGLLSGRPNPYHPGQALGLVNRWFSRHRADVIRPVDLSPQEWAWHADNPKGIKKGL